MTDRVGSAASRDLKDARAVQRSARARHATRRAGALSQRFEPRVAALSELLRATTCRGSARRHQDPEASSSRTEFHDRAGHRRSRLHRVAHGANARRPAYVVVLDTLESGSGRRCSVRHSSWGTSPTRDVVRAGRRRATASIASIHFAAYKAAGESMDDPGVLRQQRRRDGRGCSRRSGAGGPPARVLVERARSTARPRSSRSTRRRRCAREPLRPRASSWSSRCCVVRRRPTACDAVSLRYFNAAGATLDGQIGEDWRER